MKRQVTLIVVMGLAFAGFMSGQAAGQKKPEPQRASQTLASLLDEMLDMEPFIYEANLKEFLAILMDRFALKGKELPILVDAQAFENENPDAEKVYDTVIKFPSFPKRQKAGMVLRLALSKVRTGNATYLLRSGVIEITTHERAKPENLLGYPIIARFNMRPLDEAIDELSDLSGATIIIDSRLGEKAKTKVSATFKNTATLESVVRVLAEMADLRAEVRGNILFVTGKAEAEDE
jgi:hypothetical protein